MQDDLYDTTQLPDKLAIARNAMDAAKTRTERAAELARRVLHLVPGAAGLLEIGARRFVFEMAEKELRQIGRTNVFSGHRMPSHRTGAARVKRAAKKHRAVVRARKLGHA